jgi:hypothetical protein
MQDHAFKFIKKHFLSSNRSGFSKLFIQIQLLIYLSNYFISIICSCVAIVGFLYLSVFLRLLRETTSAEECLTNHWLWVILLCLFGYLGENECSFWKVDLRERGCCLLPGSGPGGFNCSFFLYGFPSLIYWPREIERCRLESGDLQSFEPWQGKDVYCGSILSISMCRQCHHELLKRW